MTPTLILGAHLSGCGDSPKVCEELAARLRRRGWPILTASHKASGAARFADIVATAAARRRDYAVAQLDVYSGRAFCWAEAAAAVMRAMRKPFVATLHGGALPEFYRRHPARVERLLRSASAVTAPSEYLAQAFERVRPDIERVPNAVDLPPAPKPLRSGSLKLVWLRAFHDLYNSILAVETLAELQRDLPHARLTMIGPDRGDGSLPRTRSRIEELGLDDSVAVRGRIPKPAVAPALAEADVFINTSRTDNTPVSLIEAMACGLPIVSTDVGGIRSLLDHDADALLVPCGSPRAMADAVLRLAREPNLAQRLGRNARAKAERFDWSRVLPRWEELLIRTAAEGAAR